MVIKEVNHVRLAKISGSTAILLIVVIFAALWALGYIEIPSKPETVLPAEQGVAVTKPLKISVIDQWAGQAVGSATVKIYKGTVLMESLTTDATGIATSALSYKSGDELHIQIVKDNAQLWKTIEVPYMSKADAESLTVNPINIPFYTLGTYIIKIMDGDGNVYSSGGTLNFTTLGKDVVTLTITIYNTQDNTGYISSYNPILGEARNPYIVLTISGTNFDKLGVQGFSYRKDLAASSVFFTQVSDDGLVKYKVGNVYQKEGTWSITITIDGSALSAGDSISASFVLKLFADGNKYLSTNVWSSETVVDAATFDLTIAK